MKRFFLDAPLTPGTLPVPEALRHRLRHVLRLEEGAALELFNAEGALAAAEVADAKCRALRVTERLPAPAPLPPLTLAVALLKREAWETVLRQATELGVTAIRPLKTDFAQVAKLNPERAHALMVEAAEQSERATLPTLHPVQSLDEFLQALTQPCAWAAERTRQSTNPSIRQPACVLVGPEGGFSPAETGRLSTHPHIIPFSLGPTILRADTAVVAALARIARTEH